MPLIPLPPLTLYTPELLQSQPDHFFVFGDNALRSGKGGQAIIRDEPNALGVATKMLPSNAPEAFFQDDDHTQLAIVLNDIARVLRLALNHPVYIPMTADNKVDLGTGLAELPQRAPALYDLINGYLHP
jgi:hypothetical protein